jgi:hypothetical protein
VTSLWERKQWVALALVAILVVVALYLAARPRDPDHVKFNLLIEGTVVSTQVVKVNH